jgi:membrane protein YqaA with SNARE-associated domain
VFKLHYLGTIIGTYLTSVDATKTRFGYTGSTNKIQAILSQNVVALSEIHGVKIINYTGNWFSNYYMQSIVMQIFKHHLELICPISGTMQIQLMPILTSAQIITQGPFCVHVP